MSEGNGWREKNIYKEESETKLEKEILPRCVFTLLWVTRPCTAEVTGFCDCVYDSETTLMPKHVIFKKPCL